MPPKAAVPGPLAGRRPHTRAHQANHLYAGLEYERPSYIRKKKNAYKILQRKWAHEVTPVAPVHDLHPLPNFAPALKPPFNPPQPIVPHNGTINFLNFIQGNAGRHVFNYLSLADYQNLRLTGRQVAVDLPAYTPHVTHIQVLGPNGNMQAVVDPTRLTQGPRPGLQGASIYLNVECQDRSILPHLRMPVGFYPGPGYVPYPQLAANWPNHAKDPRYRCNPVGQAGTGRLQPVEYYKNCDGYSLNLNPTHPRNFLICDKCAMNEYTQCMLPRWCHARILALCFECSAMKRDARWISCNCADIFRPARPGRNTNNRPHSHHLCASCRIAFTREQENNCIRKCVALGVPRRQTPVPQGQPRIYGYVNDRTWKATSALYGIVTSRNNCICGKNAYEIENSYPKHQHNNQPDYSSMYRMCLVCDDHVPVINTNRVPTTCPQ